MLLLDVNVVFYAHRAEFPAHAVSRGWLEDLLSSGELFAATDDVLAATVRLATNPRWIDAPSTLGEVFKFCDEIRSAPGWTRLSPGPRHWTIFQRLCEDTGARGDHIPDAFLAALAIENDCGLVSFDRGLRRFPGLRFIAPGTPRT